jgi:hypothetical protein
MGLMFTSQAVGYIQIILSQKFNHLPGGLDEWQSDDGAAFRDALTNSKDPANPALGQVTIDHLNLDIPDSNNGEGPDDGQGQGQSGRRWVIFWRRFRKKFPLQYNLLVDEVLKVLRMNEPAVKGMNFSAIEAQSNSDVGLTISYRQLYGQNYKVFCLQTKPWHQV